MEIGCVAGPDERDRGQEIVAKSRPNLRVFWKHMGRIIGASDGEETEYIFVEYGVAGNVHGRPITASQLRAKGVKL